MPLKITAENYDEYKMVFAIIWKHISATLHPAMVEKQSPIKFLNELEQQNKTMATRSLRMGLNDSLKMVTLLSAGNVLEIDADLKHNSLPSIETLTSVFTITIRKVLQKKGIMTENEYYLVKEHLMTSDDELAEGDRDRLYQYLEAFELAKPAK